MRLQGKVAIITGSGSGLGQAMAIRMAGEGATLVVNDIKPEAMQNTVDAIKKAGGNAIAIKADVTRPAEIRDMMKTVADNLGKIDILVNNAGINRHRPFLEMADQDWDAVLAVDLKGVFNCSQAVASYMIARHYGKILNISSTAGTGVSPHDSGNFNYAAAKAAVIQLTRSLARELGPHGINVNSIAPGAILTAITSTSRNAQQVQEHLEFRRKVTCLGVDGKPEDVADAALFLVSDESRFITGQILHVDGGRTDHM
ncbi:MAG: 3-oxoacyl-ACP reductase family protein [Dehalococcoidales bacterium]|nr:3-oxoacyl-ACP reductase family protein [Dehalococcoidales bacterium]